MRRDLAFLLPALLLLGLVALLVFHAMEEEDPAAPRTAREEASGPAGEPALPEPHRFPEEPQVAAFPRMPLPEGSAVAWIESLSAGLALAQAQDRLVLLYVAMPAPT